MSERPAEGVPADFPFETVALEMDLSIPKGLLGEQEFYKTVLLDSGWTLEPYRPNPDDEQIDFWIHLPGNPANVLCWQLKTTFELYRVHKAHRALFHVIAKAESLFTHPRMWYFLAFFDEAMRTFRDPVFVVPATFLHQLAAPIGGGYVEMKISASMELDSRDKWVPYRTSVHGVGQRIEEIFRSLPPETPAQRLAFERRTGLRLAS